MLPPATVPRSWYSNSKTTTTTYRVRFGSLESLSGTSEARDENTFEVLEILEILEILTRRKKKRSTLRSSERRVAERTRDRLELRFVASGFHSGRNKSVTRYSDRTVTAATAVTRSVVTSDSGGK